MAKILLTHKTVLHILPTRKSNALSIKIHGAKDPEQYIGRFYYDTIIHNADCFEFAVKTLGVDRIVYGTDYPADMANHQPAREIPGMSRLSEADQERILYGNAKKIYRL